jgi:hypothetical protein
MDGLGFRPPAVHHILRGGQRIGHLHTLPSVIQVTTNRASRWEW